MKVLIVGLGSIGQRHARNLRAMYGDGVEILAHRVRGLPHVIGDDLTVADGTTVEQAYGIHSFVRLGDALAAQPDAAVICNPSRLHVPAALAAARANCHLLIEKPLADADAGIEELLAVVDRNRRVATVGYQLRWHPALRRTRQLLEDGAIGPIVSASAEFGEYLPATHPYEDYRQSYAARRDLGGGVILCFIHEIDYLCWLFGMPRRLRTTGGRLGDLQIDVEDTAETEFEFALDGRSIPVRLRQSFLRKPAARYCSILGEGGSLHLDLMEPSVTVSTPVGTRRETFDGFRRNQLFEDELASFFGAIGGTKTLAVTLRDAAATARIAFAMRASLAAGRAIERPEWAMA